MISKEIIIRKRREIISVMVAMFLFCGCLFGQYKSIIVPAGTKIIENFPPSERYFYPQFIEGKLVLNNGLSSTGLINYNMLLDDMEVIQDDNDTLTILKKRELQYVIVENDTFIYMQGYAKHIYGQKLKIYCKDRIYLKEILKRGAMGAVNRSAAIESFGNFEESGVTYKLVAPEDMVFRREVSYHIVTSKGTIDPFKKKNILKLFSSQKSEIKKYLKVNKVNFEEREDVIKFAEFLSTL